MQVYAGGVFEAFFDLKSPPPGGLVRYRASGARLTGRAVGDIRAPGKCLSRSCKRFPCLPERLPLAFLAC